MYLEHHQPLSYHFHRYFQIHDKPYVRQIHQDHMDPTQRHT